MQRTPAACEHLSLPLDDDARAKRLAAHAVMTNFSADLDLQIAGIPPGDLPSLIRDRVRQPAFDTF